MLLTQFRLGAPEPRSWAHLDYKLASQSRDQIDCNNEIEALKEIPATCWPSAKLTQASRGRQRCCASHSWHETGIATSGRLSKMTMSVRKPVVTGFRIVGHMIMIRAIRALPASLIFPPVRQLSRDRLCEIELNQPECEGQAPSRIRRGRLPSDPRDSQIFSVCARSIVWIERRDNDLFQLG